MSVTRRLAKLYAELPTIECRGLCHAACGPIPATETEWSLAGEIKYDATLTCNKLGLDHRCTVYEKRPLICRMFGLIDDPKMKCPHGCLPSRWLTHADARDLFARVERIAGPMLMPRQAANG